MDIVARLRELANIAVNWLFRPQPEMADVMNEAAALIETQAAEMERLRRQNDIARGFLPSIGKCQASVNGHLARVGLAAMEAAIEAGSHLEEGE